MSPRIAASLVVVATAGVAAQDMPGPGEDCFSAGSVAGAVLGTLVAGLALAALAYLLYRVYWRKRRGKHLVLVTDPERADIGDKYAFDNPCFRDGTPIGKGGYEKEPVKSETKSRWSQWSPLGALVGNHSEKRRALDDSFTGEPQVNVVSLRSHDFTGLGFSICGNMRDGIFVKDVLHRGPASESGRITPGDRIDSIRISFRHMVFEDALTILSYASPYEVQLEVENPLPSSRPSTLLRTKRETLEPADRICHPFYRSQSIADLAQIGTASLKRVQDMGGLKSPRRVKGEGWDDSRTSQDYPTLKLSPSPAKERVNLEKTASPSNPTSVAIVKPERTKRPSPQLDGPSTQPRAEPNKEVVGKHQKFGVWSLGDGVLPDPKALAAQLKSVSEKMAAQSDTNVTPLAEKPQDTAHASDVNPHVKKPNVSETEHQENEQNSKVEQISTTPVAVKTNVVAGQAGGNVDVVDASKPYGRLVPVNLFYDERGIDVGPMEEEENRRKSASYELKKEEELAKRQSADGATAADNHNNVKLLLTKGLQNLKEKLHHHDKKKTSTTPEPQSDVEVNPNPSPSKKKPGKSEKSRKSSSSDSDGTPEKVEVKMRPKSEIKMVNKESKEDPKKEVKVEAEYQAKEGQIPTELPEEVHRAAAAARSNRKSCGNLMPDVSIVSQGPDKTNTTDNVQVSVAENRAPSVSPKEGANPKQRVHHQESLSEDSSGEHNDAEGADRVLKKSNKRKAPPPPPEEGDDSKNSHNTKTDQVKATDVQQVKMVNDPHNRIVSKSADGLVMKMESTLPNILNGGEVHVMGVNSSGGYPTFTEMGRQQNNPTTENQITNIIVESNSVPGTNTLKVEMSGADEIDVDELSPSSKPADANSESDSDVEQREAEASFNQNKKGGTTIELNSSHITIHHSPSVDTVTVELEADNTRKAASLGDLSRFDTDQPMSVLERAVSLDLVDSGTPHSSKKRKAPLPPPGDDFVTNVQDNEDEALYRKEPRLDSALDTFQRRRLKKSSDWGTMEDAVQHSSPPTSRKPLNLTTDVNIVVPQTIDLKLDGTTKGEEMETNETEVTEEKHTKNVVPLETVITASIPKASARTFDSTTQSHLFTSTQINPDDGSHMQGKTLSTKIDHDGEGNTESVINVLEGPQKTVLRITPEPSNNVDLVTSSHVTFAPTSSTSGPASINAHEIAESRMPDKDAEVDVNGGHSLTFIQGQEGDSPFEVDASYVSAPVVSQSVEHHTIVSSTPLPNRDLHTRYIDSVQSQHVTSTDGGVQNIQVVSSSTHNTALPMSDMMNMSRIGRNLLEAFESNVSNKLNDSYNEPESSVVVTSATDPYITAGSVVDSTTTYASNSDDEDSTMGQDSPPELPTSPVPVLGSSYTPSSSMTYITEIQVSTITPSKAVTSHTITHNGNLETEAPIRKRESSISSDSIGSGGEDKDTDIVHDSKPKEESSTGSSNVTVTSIRNSSPGSSEKSKIPMRIGTETILTTFQNSPNVGMFDRSQIPIRGGTEGIMTTFQSSPTAAKTVETSQIPVRVGTEGILTTFKSNVSVGGSGDKSLIPTRVTTSTVQEGSTILNNGPSFGEKKGKAVRPPVPPRKSDTSVSSVVTVEIPSPTNSTDNSHSKFVSGSTPYTIYDSTSNAQNNGGSKKFISFSSLMPRTVGGDGAVRNSSSFEQWVFLDGDSAHSSNGDPHNGQDATAEDGGHPGAVTLPSALAGRPSSVTHILLDAKQSSGSRSTQ